MSMRVHGHWRSDTGEQIVEGEETGLDGEGTSAKGTREANWGEAGVFKYISVQQLSKTIFLASHSTTKMKEAEV